MNFTPKRFLLYLTIQSHKVHYIKKMRGIILVNTYKEFKRVQIINISPQIYCNTALGIEKLYKQLEIFQNFHVYCIRFIRSR